MWSGQPRRLSTNCRATAHPCLTSASTATRVCWPPVMPVAWSSSGDESRSRVLLPCAVYQSPFLHSVLCHKLNSCGCVEEQLPGLPQGGTREHSGLQWNGDHFLNCAVLCSFCPFNKHLLSICCDVSCKHAVSRQEGGTNYVVRSCSKK